MGLLTNGVRFLRKHGLRAVCRAAVRRSKSLFPSVGRERRALPYSFAFEPIKYDYNSPPPDAAPAPGRINWVIPDFYGTSGGHRTIFRLTRALEAAGYEVSFYVFGETHFVSDSEATEVMREHYFPLKATVHAGVGRMPPSRFCLASSWETAYAVKDFDACYRKIYFVQDFEPSFYPASTEMRLAEETYRFGFECVCAGQWLAQKMREYGNYAESFNLAYDPAVYFVKPGPYLKNRVVFYARHETRRRGTELGLLALALLKRRLPDTEIVLFGSHELPYELPFEYTSAGGLGEHELADLYRSAAAGLSVSLTNYSLVPQEMLACGLPVIEMDLPPLRAPYPDGSPGIRLAPPIPSEIADALVGALSLPDPEASRAREAAARLVSHLSWSEAGRALIDFLGRNGFDRDSAPDNGMHPTPHHGDSRIFE